jgi:hypothetical protein
MPSLGVCPIDLLIDRTEVDLNRVGLRCDQME